MVLDESNPRSLLLAFPSVASADSSVSNQGCQTRTHPKQVQVSTNGIRFLRAPCEKETARRSGRRPRPGGCQVEARPTEDVAVELGGCPGRLKLLKSIFSEERGPVKRSRQTVVAIFAGRHPQINTQGYATTPPNRLDSATSLRVRLKLQVGRRRPTSTQP